jgi:predicted dehydrogenase
MKVTQLSRILIIGTGSIANRHHLIAKSLFPEAEICAYSESGNRIEGIRMLRSLAEIENFHPQLSVIANKTNKHLDYAIFLANLSSHLLLEKPISIDLSGVDELLEVRKRNNIKMLVGYNLEYLDAYKFIMKLLKEEKIGRILDVRIEAGQNLESWRPNRDYRQTVSAKQADGGGVLRELSHEIHYLINLFGMPNWVFASQAKVSNLEIDVMDIAHVILGMNCKRGSEFMATLSLDFVRQDKTRKCIIIGTKSTLEWDILAGTINESTGQGRLVRIFSSTNDSISDTYLREWIDLIEAISLDREPLASLTVAINSLEVVLTCEKSHQNRSRVDFLPKKWST